jgi:hypothetical protein
MLVSAVGLYAVGLQMSRNSKNKSNEDCDVQRQQDPTKCTASLLDTKVYKPQSRHRNEGDLDCFRHARVAEIHA